MDNEYFRDRTGRIVGRTDGNWLRNRQGKLIARYDAWDNRTRRRDGQIVGERDQRLRTLDTVR